MLHLAKMIDLSRRGRQVDLGVDSPRLFQVLWLRRIFLLFQVSERDRHGDRDGGPMLGLGTAGSRSRSDHRTVTVTLTVTPAPAVYLATRRRCQLPITVRVTN